MRALGAIGVTLAACAAALPAWGADQPPRLAPRQDLTVVYRVTQTAPEAVAGSFGNMTAESTIYLSAKGRQRHETRVTAMGGGPVASMLAGQPPQVSLVELDGTTLRSRMLDNATKTVLTHEQAVEDLAWTDLQFLEAPPGTTPKRVGSETVAGQPCTLWRLQDDADGKAEACYTAEGLALRFRQAGADGVVSTREAVSVTPGPLDPALFEPPQGWAVR